jgi:hypothetical protein
LGTKDYEQCDDGTPECGYEKIAIYVRSGEVKHVARQLPDGRWTSKLGPGYLIEHSAVEDLEHLVPEITANGLVEVQEKVEAYMKRLRPCNFFMYYSRKIITKLRGSNWFIDLLHNKSNFMSDLLDESEHTVEGIALLIASGRRLPVISLGLKAS